MFKFHPSFETPESSTSVWRYMDFVTFVWILQHSALWFSRADYFEDKWEGAYPVPTLAALKASMNESGTWDRYSEMITEIRYTIYINCWYANDYESAAMWQLYAGAGNAIAIRSTVARLSESLSTDARNIHIGKIKYIDYEKDALRDVNIFLPYLCKRRSFEHESEVRLIMWSSEESNATQDERDLRGAEKPAGHAIKADLNKMLESVYVSPKAKAWFVDLVKDVLVKYAYGNVTIKQSDFEASPPA